jgi:acetolactate synthase-1/2/3 large subunit
MAHMTGGQAIVKQLQAEGVDTIFGIIGNSTFSLYDALYAEPSIRHYTARNELGAASMADGYARVTGRPGVCFSTVGPGAAHTLSALGEAYTESSPVLHITSQIESDLVGKHRGVYHESPDQLALFRPLTMWTYRVSAVADIPWAIHEALRLFKTRRPQPVHLEVPTDIIAGTGDADIIPAAEYEPARAETAEVRRAVERLLQAERPIIYAGGGVTRAGASAELRELAEMLQAPVVNTCVGKGTIPGDHPLALGHLMMTPPVRALIESADVMLAIGTRFTPRATAGWSITMPQQLIQIDLDPTQFGKNYAAELCLLGDARAVLQQVLEEVLRAGPLERPARTAEVEAARTAGYNGLKEQFPRELRILEEIRELLPRNGVLCAQSIIGHWSRVAFPVYEPGTYLYANSFGSMGWTFQAGFGAKFALPERKVVTICGDGGMMVNCGELASAVENGVKMPVVVFNNGGYYIMKLAQEQRYNRHYLGVDLHNPDFVKLAEAFGAKGVRLSSMDAFKPALQEALEADALTLIEYPILLNPPSQR